MIRKKKDQILKTGDVFIEDGDKKDVYITLSTPFEHASYDEPVVWLLWPDGRIKISDASAYEGEVDL
jgi:hypothetical protein